MENTETLTAIGPGWFNEDVTASDLADLIADHLDGAPRRSVVYVQSENGAPLALARIVRRTLSDGSFVCNLILSFDD